MDILNTYMPLQEEIVYKSLESKVLNLLPNGIEGAWLVKVNDEYAWGGDCTLDFDVLQNYECIRNAMVGKSLIITFKEKLFTVELSYRRRVGGYKEPFENVCVASVSAHSLMEALHRLNTKLCGKEEVCNSDIDHSPKPSVVDFENYRLKRKVKYEKILK